MTDAARWMAAARYYLQRGLSIIPMGSDKRPAIKWKEYQDRRATESELRDWPKENIAIVTGRISNIVVVDCESRGDAVWFWKERGESPVVSKTRRGFHIYFRWPGSDIRNARAVEGKYDVRGEGGYVLAPPSRHRDGRYEWVKRIDKTEDLPPFKTIWRPDNRPVVNSRNIRDAVRYIEQIRAVSGSGGHDKTWKAACILAASGMSQAEAMLVLLRWNATNAEPPWSERDLLHKLEGAFRDAGNR